MPNREEGSHKRRMVVEEIEIPAKKSDEVVEIDQKSSSETEIQQVVSEPGNVSSQDIMKNDNIQTAENPKDSKKAINPIFEHSEKPEKQKSPVFWILIPGIFILGAILGGIIFYQKGVNTITPEKTTTPVATTEATSTPIPTSTPSSSIDVSKFDVAIFNGSGIAGEAGKVKDILTSAGFNVTSTGNAATYDYTKTIIKAKTSIDSAIIQKLKDALSKAYVVGDSQTLSSSSTTDIQVVVGSSKN